MSFSHDGTTLATTTDYERDDGSPTSSVVLFDVTMLTWSPAAQAEAACRRIGGVGLGADDGNRHVPDRQYRAPCRQ